jgi:hypothetical protein
MKNLGIYVLTIIGLFGCGTDKIPAERISLDPVVINEGLSTNFPGELFVDENYFYTPSSSSRYYLGIHDLKTGEEIAGTVRIGKGPQEFITPMIQQITEQGLFVYDPNLRREAFFPINDAILGKYNCQMLPKKETVMYNQVLSIDDETQVIFQPVGTYLFQLWRSNEITEFGEPFTGSISNANIYIQGEIAYHNEKHKLVYTNFFLPYIAIYNYRKGSFNLVSERKDFGKLNIQKDRLKIDKTRNGISALTLSKDYIVCIQRDYENDFTDESTVGRDFSKLFHTVFLYSFDCELEKIVDLGSPVLRLASTQQNNVLYATIFRNDEFQVVKYQLPL